MICISGHNKDRQYYNSNIALITGYSLGPLQVGNDHPEQSNGYYMISNTIHIGIAVGIMQYMTVYRTIEHVQL